MKLSARKIKKEFLRIRENTNVFCAVKETDFSLQDGCLTTIYGKSGSGKSTFLNMLAGILLPTSGEVIWEAQEIYRLSDSELSRLRNRMAGFIPQGQTPIASLTVEENILLPYTLYGEKLENQKLLDEWMERLEIADLRHVFPNQLSGGELKRLSVARALIKDPQVIFADEPTADLDEENTHIVLEILKEQADLGKSVLIVTHEKEAEKYSDAIYQMKAGELCPIQS